jgi:hypothetical protein
MTTATTIPNLSIFLEDLKSADLVGISLVPDHFGLHLDFTYGPDFGDVAIELYQIVHLIFSQPFPSQELDSCFWVGEVQLNQISPENHHILSTLSYPFNHSNLFNSDLLNSPLVHFHLEGEICLEVICSHYKVFQ